MTIRRDRNDRVIQLASVCATWEAFNPIATPEELLEAVNSQIYADEALTLQQVKTCMRQMGRPVEEGSNHYVKTHYYTR